jgi:hypothetical protein
MIARMGRLLAQRRFRRVSFAIMRESVERIKDLTVDELGEAVMRHQEENKQFDDYYAPHLENVLPHLLGEEKEFEDREDDPGSSPTN